MNESTSVIGHISVSSQAEGHLIAKGLLEKQLIACAHIFPLGESLYVWDGQLQQTNEHQLIVKTVSDHTEAIVAFIQDMHSYDCPEILFTDVVCGAPQYLRWVQEQTHISDTVGPSKG